MDAKTKLRTNNIKSAYMDRDSAYRIAALECAVERSKQYGGQSLNTVDVPQLAEVYYGWLKGNIDSEKPVLEKFQR